MSPPSHDVTPPPLTVRPTSQFQRDAAAVLSALKLALQNVLITLNVRRPVDLQRLLNLDNRLAWTLFKVATDNDTLAVGTLVPARVSIDKFISAATAKDVPSAHLLPVLSAYEAFERLVETHADDRNTFNSLIAAVRGISDEWLANDFQHRRNIFRSLSAVMGHQAKTRLSCSVIYRIPEPPGFEFLVFTSLIGLRLLQPLDRVRVHGTRTRKQPFFKELAPHQPLTPDDSKPHHGFLLENFSTHPLPKLETVTGERDWGSYIETVLINPEIGNVGACSFTFAEVYRSDKPPRSIGASVNMPTELLLLDALIDPTLFPDLDPVAYTYLGQSDPLDRAPDQQLLKGKHEPALLGQGPDFAATPDIPHYPQLLRFAAQKLNRNYENYTLIRLRLDYPLYHSTAHLSLAP